MLKNKQEQPVTADSQKDEQDRIKAADFKDSVLEAGAFSQKKSPKTDRLVVKAAQLEDIEIESISNDRSNVNLDEISIQLTDKDFDGNKSKNEITLKIEHAASGKVKETPEIASSKVPSFSEAATAAPVSLFTPAFKEAESAYPESSVKVKEFKEESKQNKS